LPFATNLITLAIAIGLMPLGTPFTFPCASSLLSRVIDKHERGVYMGVQQTSGGITRAIIPVVAGFSYDNLGKGVPFWTSAILAIAVYLLSFGIKIDNQSV